MPKGIYDFYKVINIFGFWNFNELTEQIVGLWVAKLFRTKIFQNDSLSEKNSEFPDFSDLNENHPKYSYLKKRILKLTLSSISIS